MSELWDPSKSQYERNPSGSILLGDVEVGHTVQCAHCNKHWVSIRGSGHIRGICVRCGGRTCGARSCDVCVPYERWMEQQEALAR